MTKEEEPDCRYCKHKLTWSCTHIPTKISTGPYKDIVVETYWCNHCKSEQNLSEDGQELDYNFMVGPYKLCFYPLTKSFEIHHCPNGRKAATTPVAKIKELPTHLKPDDMTEERVKCIITFS